MTDTFFPNLTSEKAEIEKVKNVFIPCCLKFYKKLTKSQMDELVMVMKEINSKISGVTDEKKGQATKVEKMFLKAECSNEKNNLKGNPVQILLNNFPLAQN